MEDAITRAVFPRSGTTSNGCCGHRDVPCVTLDPRPWPSRDMTWTRCIGMPRDAARPLRAWRSAQLARLTTEW